MHKAEFKGIWTDEYYEKIQNEIKRRAYVGGRTILNNSILIGLLKCSYCGKSMYQTKTRRTFLNGFKYLYRGYACGSFMHGGTCRSNGKAQKVVDGMVLKEVLKFANDNTRNAYLKKINESKVDNRADLFASKEKEFKRKLNEFDRVTQAYREGADSLEEYRRNKEELIPVIERLQGEVIALKAQANSPLTIDWKKRYEDVISKFVECPADKDRQVVRQMLIHLIGRIEFKSNPLYIKIFYKTIPQQ